MKPFFILIAALFVAGGGAAELLRNADFQTSGPEATPSGWSLRDRKVKPELPDRPTDRPAVSTADGMLTLDTVEGRFEVMLIQFRLPLARNGEYVFSFEVRGEGAPACRGVVHYQTTEGGKRIWKHTDGSWSPAPEKWQARELTFRLPADVSDAYLYFGASGIGKVNIRNIRLREAGIELENPARLRIFKPGETIAWRIGFKHAPENEIRYEVKNFLGETVASGRERERIVFDALPNGYYALSAKEYDRAGKKESATACTFAVIPEVPKEVRDSSANQFGVMVNPHTAYPLEEKERDMEFSARIGVRYLRTHRLSWGRVQSGPDAPFNWREADAEMALYKKYGIRPVATIGWPVPTWASDAAGTDVPNKTNYFPQEKYLPQLKRFYRELAARYGDAIAFYEVGNEVDASNFWMGRLAHAQAGDDNAVFRDYAEFYRAVASSVLAGNPEAKIGPGTTGAVPAGHSYKPWLEMFWSDPEALKYTTIFCPHYMTDIPAIREVMRKHGKEVPIVLTEIGGLVRTESDTVTPELLRQLIKRTYVQYATQLNRGGLALCKFLLRRIPGVREGWISEMLDADFSIRPGYVAYATLIRLTGAGIFEHELNVTRNASSGWAQGFRISTPRGIVNLIMLNDTDRATVTLKTPEREITVIDVMGAERRVAAHNGVIALEMAEDQPLFLLGEIGENDGPVKHPEPELILKRTLALANGGFESPGNGGIPGWRKVVDEAGGTGGEAPFRVELDSGIKSGGAHSLRMSSEKQTRWYGVLCELPMNEIPVPKAGEYLIFTVSYDQKIENVVGTGAGLTLACRTDNMRRVGFNDGNWVRGSFDWTEKRWTSRVYSGFSAGTKKLTLEFYLGVATGTVWIDNVTVEVALYRKSNAASAYIN